MSAYLKFTVRSGYTFNGGLFYNESSEIHTWKSIVRLCSSPVLAMESLLGFNTLPVEDALFRITSGTCMELLFVASRFSSRSSFSARLAFCGFGKVSTEPVRVDGTPKGLIADMIPLPETFSILPVSLALDSWDNNILITFQRYLYSVQLESLGKGEKTGESEA